MLSGTFVAHVTSAKRHGALWVEQHMTSFEPWVRGPAVATKLLNNHQRVRPGTVSWFEEFHSHASLTGARSSLTHGTTAEYVGSHTPSLEHVSTNERDYVWVDLLPQKLALHEEKPPSKAELAKLAAARRLTTDQAVEQYVQRVHNKLGIQDTWPPLETYLEAKPEAAKELVDKMRRGDVPPEATMGMYVALGNAHTPQAKAALEGIMNNPAAPVFERSRAIVSLIDRDDEGVDLANTLAQMSQALVDHHSKGARILGRQSLLALGAMSGRKPDNAEVKDVAERTITSSLEQTRDKNALYKRPVYGAIANVGDPKMLRLVADIPDNPDPDVRRAAAIVFRRMPPKASADFAARWLAKETDASVLRKLWHTIELQTYDARQMTTPDVLRYAVRDLRKKPGPITRKALIRLLCRAKDAMPDAKLGIEDAFAELIPWELKQKSGFYHMMSPYIDPERLQQIYRDATPAETPDSGTKAAPTATDDNDDAKVPLPGSVGPASPAAGGFATGNGGSDR